jgi:hypothetical protein
VAVDRLMFPRPTDEFIYVERMAVDGVCSECGASRLARYPIANSMGPRIAVRCLDCLHFHSIQRPTADDHWPPWASATQGWPTSRAG